MPILVCLQKIRAISGLSGKLKAQFLVTHGCFAKKPLVFEIYVEFEAFLYQICRGSKNLAGKIGKFGLKALFVSFPFIARVAEALDHERTNEDFRGCRKDDKPVFNEKINK